MAIPIQLSDATVPLVTSSTKDVPGAWVLQVTATTDITKISVAIIGLTGDNSNNDVVIDIGTGEAGSEVRVIKDIHWGDTGTNVSQGGRNQGWLLIPWFFASGTKISARITGLENGDSSNYEFQLIAME